jgi:pyroglutamyl-peptidase
MARLVLPFLLLAACAGDPGAAPDVSGRSTDSMDDALLRDFHKSQKLDESGHPVNAVVVEAERFCTGPGGVVSGGYRSAASAGKVCNGTLPQLPGGDLMVNVRLRAIGIDTTSKAQVVKVGITSADPTSVTMTGKAFRADGQWTYVPLSFYNNESTKVGLTVETFGRGAIEVDYIEIFPNQFPLALGPGSGVLADGDEITVEGPLGGQPPVLTVNGRDVHLADLVQAQQATRTDTSYRSVYTVTVATLADGRSGDLDLFARDPSDPAPTARMRVYRAAPPCAFQGDSNGKRVLLTGFQPFPVAETHPNVSDVAVQALDVSKLIGAQVMRLELPVEYDDAPAIVADAIARCTPDFVIDFGQGADSISLEHTAYNLKDTGSAVDNRGRFEAGIPISADGPDTLSSGLPLAKIKQALEAMPVDAAIGKQHIEDSDDPGRYVCNNTFYAAVTAATGRPVSAGFIHLPYTTDFTDASRAAWGEIARTAVEALVGQAAVATTGTYANQ